MARSIGLLKKLVAVPLLKKSVAVLLSLLAVALGIAGCGSSSPGVPAGTQGVSSTAGSAATNVVTWRRPPK
jgi:ABC-type glycerol-3-phosphate transport system substrate-binding protein